MAGLPYGSDLDDVLADLADTGDPDIDLLVTGLRNIAHRARTGALSRERTQLLTAVIAASPDATDVVGALGLLLVELTADTTPVARQLTDQARKEAVHAGEQAAFLLTDPDLRDPASRACAALDHAERGCTDMDGLTDEQRKELSRKNAEKNRQSTNRPR